MSGERTLSKVVCELESDLEDFKGLMLTTSMGNKQKDIAVEYMEKMIEFLKLEQKGKS